MPTYDYKKGRVTKALQILDLLETQELEDFLKGIRKDQNPHSGIKLLSLELMLGDRLLTANTSELNRQLSRQIQQLPKLEINQVPKYLQKIPKNTVLLYPLILSDRKPQSRSNDYRIFA